MNDDELIASLVRKNVALEQENIELKDKANRIIGKLVCIGGPLNDNFHQYSKEQLGIFFQIMTILET